MQNLVSFRINKQTAIRSQKFNMNNFNDSFEKNYGKSVLSNLVPNSLKDKFNSRLAYAPTSASSASSLSESTTRTTSRNLTNPIINLKDLVDSYARKLFKENEREYYKAIGKQCSWRDLAKEIDWSNFRIKHCDTKYEDAGSPGQVKSHVLFRSTYVNETDEEQDYQLAAERKTVSACSFEMFEGFVNEGQAELSVRIPIPGCAGEAGAGFRREYTLESCRAKSVQEEMNWSVHSNIKVRHCLRIWNWFFFCIVFVIGAVEFL